MMKNKSVRSIFFRKNAFLNGLLTTFWAFSSYPRLVLEVFIRRNMGERYFNLASGLTVGVLLALIPGVISIFSNFRMYRYLGEQPSFWGKYVLWYVFVAGYVYCTFQRWFEQRKGGSVYTLDRVSFTTGVSLPLIDNIKFGNKPLSPRAIEIFIEPGIFFVAGLVLWLIDQPLGFLFLICSVFYSLSYAGAYRLADEDIMDRLDSMIVGDVLHNVIVENLGPEKTKGVKMYGRKPSSRELNEQLYRHIKKDWDDSNQIDDFSLVQ